MHLMFAELWFFSRAEVCLLTDSLCVISPVSKTQEEIQEILERKEAQLREKESRRKKQEENVAQKKQNKEENK